ncbi:hypothetical protein AA313_de0201413 [Arthrobotrys entomopaga]|nr:hypothetical protein AA313_de0201413 [Arthrobotrys entomopaga]
MIGVGVDNVGHPNAARKRASKHPFYDMLHLRHLEPKFWDSRIRKRKGEIGSRSGGKGKTGELRVAISETIAKQVCTVTFVDGRGSIFRVLPPLRFFPIPASHFVYGVSFIGYTVAVKISHDCIDC